MCDPVTLGLALGASVGGGFLTQQNQLSNAQAQANAANGVLGETIGLDKIYRTNNAPAFSGAMAGYSGDAGLTGAQGARTATNLSNIPGVSAGIPAGTTDAPPALAKAYGTAMDNANNFATNAGKASGTLGGYGDSLFNAGLGEQEGERKIGVGNTLANSLKNDLEAKQQLAMASAYKPPSIWGQVLTGAGSILGSAAGSNKSPNGPQLPFGIGSLFAPTPSQMLAPYTGGDSASSGIFSDAANGL